MDGMKGVAARKRSGLFVTHTNANTERTLRRARTFLHELVCGGRLVFWCKNTTPKTWLRRTAKSLWITAQAFEGV